jgi:DNA-binding transcriptional MerR regulator
VETIRFYERKGVLSAPARGENNYRQYLPIHAERLGFIRHCRNLDMTLAEIRALIDLRESRAKDCGDINELLEKHIGHVAERIRELRMLKRDLEALRAQCTSPHSVLECGILNGLDRAAVKATAKPPKPPKQRQAHGVHGSSPSHKTPGTRPAAGRRG